MRFFSGILFGFFLVGGIIAVVVALGGYNVAATATPSRLESRVALFALNRSVARRAPVAKNPHPATPETWKAGLPHYRENCVMCHGAPGVDPAELGMGLNPPAPDLTLPRVQGRPDGEMYWLVANGVRTTGMPAFSPTHKPNEIWQIVAFLRHLPELTAEEQKALKSEPSDHKEDPAPTR